MANGFDWFCPDDLPLFFKALQKAPSPAILVGGQSLTFWIDWFSIPIPPLETTYLTKDVDVLATKHDAKIVAEELHGTLRMSDMDDHTPNTAIVTYRAPDGRKLFVDFMGSLIGLTNNEIRETAVEMEHPTYGLIRVLHPTLVLKSRIENLYQLQVKRDANGIEQARLAVQVARVFFEEFAKLMTEDPDGYLIDRVGWLQKLALSDAAIYVFANYGIDVLDAAPVHQIKTEMFHSEHWPRTVERVKKKRAQAMKRMGKVNMR
ncbi:hypothetical protein [Sideroxydans sp.]